MDVDAARLEAYAICADGAVTVRKWVDVKNCADKMSCDWQFGSVPSLTVGARFRM
jgi:hypothetical protein